jgi:uncharacterized protein
MASGKIRNFDLLSTYSYFVPNPLKLLTLALFFVLGAGISNVLYFFSTMYLGESQAVMMVVYVIMFIPPMLYASSESHRNLFLDEGRQLDSRHFGKRGVLLVCASVMAATIALSFIMDGVSVALLPEMPDYLKDMFSNMTSGNLVINFLMVSVFAPFFEEWLCRGMILRGLLWFRRRPALNPETGEMEERHGIGPVWAILISALFFAVIHFNPWQALPAFTIGCLFGYVYYRTGSLKLTMLMHFTNNTMALVMGNVDSLKDADTWLDVLSVGQYSAVAVIFAVLLFLVVRMLGKIELQSRQGNCDGIKL